MYGTVHALVVEGPHGEFIAQHIVCRRLHTQNLLSGGNLTARDILQLPDHRLVVPVGEVDPHVQVAADLIVVDDQLNGVKPVPCAKHKFVRPAPRSPGYWTC